MRLRTLPAAALALLAACDAAEPPTFAAAPETPAAAIYHWPSGGTKGFHFVPWSPPANATPNPFDPGLSPVVTVCRLVNGACGPTVATFSRTSGSFGRRVTVNAADEQYEVDWPTGSSNVSPGQIYRVSVRVGARELGYGDVQMVGSFWELFAVDGSQYVGWLPGWTLPINFRIETGIPGSIALSSTSLAVGVGEGKPFTAQVRDLHGQPLATDWLGLEMESTSSAPGPVAVLDSGLVVGAHPGTAILWAWVEDLVVQVPVTVADNRRSWPAHAGPAPADAGFRALWGAAANNLFAAGHTGLLRHQGTGWTFVDALRWRSLHDVFGLSATNVWAVGDEGLIARFDGTAWSAQRFDGTGVAPHPLSAWTAPAQRVSLRGVWGASPASVLAVGEGGTALRFNGTTWSVAATGTTATLTDVWGSGTTAFAPTSDGRVVRITSTTAAPMAGLQAPGALHAVWGSSASNVYVVGDGGALYRYNGTSWTRIRLPTRVTLHAVWGTSASNVYVGGEGGTVYRFDGTAWTPEKLAGGGQLYDFWGTGSAPALAVGAAGVHERR